MARKSIGIDVSKKTLDVYFSSASEWDKYDNAKAGIKLLLKRISKEQPEIVVLEATGAYSRELIAALQGADIAFIVVNPRRLRDFARGLGILAKSDKLDARVIAKYGEKSDDQPKAPATTEEQTLKDLCTRRLQLIDMRTQEKNRLSQMPVKLRKSIKNIIKILQKEINKIDATIGEHVANTPQLSDKAAKLHSAKGISTVTSSVLMAFLPELGKLNKKQIAALAGLAPFAHESGNFKGQRSIYGGRTIVRSALYMATLSAIRFDKSIKENYQRLVAAGKNKKVALIACARKLLISLNAMLRDGSEWKQSTV